MLHRFRILPLVFLIFTSTASSITVFEGKEQKSSAAINGTASLKERHVFYLGFDAYSRSLIKTTSSANGTEDLFSPVRAPIMFAYTYKFSTLSRIQAQLDYTLFPRKGPDYGQTETFLLFRVPYVKRLGASNFEWKAGLSLRSTRLIGQGGPVELNNGTGTAIFYQPSGTTETNIFLTEFGIALTLEKILIEGGFLVEAPFNNKNRNVSMILGLAYQIGAN